MAHGFGSIVLGCDVGLSLEIWHGSLMSAHIHPTEDPNLPGRVSGYLVIQWRDRITPIPACCPWGKRDQPARFSGSRRASASSARPLPVRTLVDSECLRRSFIIWGRLLVMLPQRQDNYPVILTGWLFRVERTSPPAMGGCTRRSHTGAVLSPVVPTTVRARGDTETRVIAGVPSVPIRSWQLASGSKNRASFGIGPLVRGWIGSPP
jgi:hypothetical protein